MPRKSSGNVRQAAAALGAVVVVLAAGAIWADPAGLFHRFRLIWHDECFRMRHPVRTSDDITHIDIDDQSIAKLGRWPWTRTTHAELVRTLKGLGARLVVFDVEFSEPSPPQVNEDYVRSDLSDGVLRTLDDLLARAEAEDGADSTRALAQAIARARQDVGQKLAMSVKDPDSEFAAAVRTAGNVILAYSVEDETPAYQATVGRQKLNSLEQLLAACPDATSADAARVTGIPQSELDTWLEEFRDTFLVGAAVAFLEDHPSATADAFASWLARRGSKDVGSNRPETRARPADKLLKAFNAAGARRLVTGPGAPRGQWLPGEEAPAALVPILPLARAARDFGFTNARRDAADGVMRRVPLVKNLDGKAVMYLGLVAACRYLGVPPDGVRLLDDGTIVLEGVRGKGGEAQNLVIPSDRAGNIPVNWPQSTRRDFFNTFKHVPYLTVIELAQTRNELDALLAEADALHGGGRVAAVEADLRGQGLPPDEVAERIAHERAALLLRLKSRVRHARNQILAETDPERRADLEGELLPLEERIDRITDLSARRDKIAGYLKERIAGAICIVGAAFTGGTDFHPTPVEPAMPGSGLVSAVANMIIKGDFVRVAGRRSGLVIALVMGMIVVVIGVASRPLKALGASIAFVVTSSIAAFLIFDASAVLFDISGGVFASAAGFITVATYREFTEERHKRFIRHAFEHYLSPEVVGRLVEDPSSLSLGGQKREVTVLFADLQGFTRLAEGMSPAEVVNFLNRFLGVLGDTVMACGGYLDKYEGDAVLAVFGAPVAALDHATAACRAAIEFQRALAEIEVDGKAVTCRAGIATGEVVVGNIGSRERFDYTVIGDTVNVAARLEAANKSFGTRVMLSASTAQRLPEDFRLRRLGRLRLEGRAEPEEAYELLADQTVVIETYEPFNRGLQAFEAGQLEAAAVHFGEALKAHPDDGAAAAFIEKCQYLIPKPPAVWDGLFYARIK